MTVCSFRQFVYNIISGDCKRRDTDEWRQSGDEGCGESNGCRDGGTPVAPLIFLLNFPDISLMLVNKRAYGPGYLSCDAVQITQIGSMQF